MPLLRKMGCVDTTNLFIVNYRCGIRGKKWYWPLFINAIAIIRVAAWRLMIASNNGRAKMDQLFFLREVVKGLASRNRVEVPQGAVSRCRDHAQVLADKQGRCKVCEKMRE